MQVGCRTEWWHETRRVRASVGAKQARGWCLQVVIQRATFLQEIVEANVALPNSPRADTTPGCERGGREVGNSDVESKGKWKEFIPGCKLVVKWE
jgi:hypothetical protein